MTMVVHELCTNALKYGSLGTPGGRVDLAWSIQNSEEGRLLVLIWRERGGPIVRPPEGRGGFGTRMIGRALSGLGRTEVKFDPAGLICLIEIAMTKAVEPAMG